MTSMRGVGSASQSAAMPGGSRATRLRARNLSMRLLAAGAAGAAATALRGVATGRALPDPADNPRHPILLNPLALLLTLLGRLLVNLGGACDGPSRC